MVVHFYSLNRLKLFLYGVMTVVLAFAFVGCTKAAPALQSENIGTTNVGGGNPFSSTGGTGVSGSFGSFGSSGSAGASGTTGASGSTGSTYPVTLQASPSTYVNVGSAIILTASGPANLANASFQYQILASQSNITAIAIGSSQIQISSSVAASFSVRANLLVNGVPSGSATIPLNFYSNSGGGGSGGGSGGGGGINIPNIAGNWYIGSLLCNIQQNGYDLVLRNELGNTSVGSLTSSNTLIAYNWNNITGTISADGMTIAFSNNTTWSRNSNGAVPLLLASNFVGATETGFTPSPFSSDLATPDAVNLGVSVPTTAIIAYTASVNAGGGFSGDCYDGLIVDGQTINLGSVSQTYNAEHHFEYTIALNPGSHNIRISHATNNGIICSWSNRMLTVMGASSINPVLIGTQVISTGNTTTTQNSNYVHLSQPDSLTFSLNNPINAMVSYNAIAYLNSASAGGDCYDALVIDGTTVSIRSVSSSAAGNTQHNLAYTINLAAGSHTIGVKHAANNNLSCTYSNRVLTVLSVGAPRNDLLGSQYYAGSQAMTSANPNFAPLATSEQITVNLAQSTYGFIQYGANVYLSGNTPADCYDALYIDGSLIYSTSQTHNPSSNAEHSLNYVAPLAAGSHTIQIKHAVNNAMTCNYSARSLSVMKAY